MTDSQLRSVAPRLSLAGADLCVGVVFLLGFWLLARQPLYHSDLWAHLSYGRVYAEKGRFPKKEPFLPLAKVEPYISNCWLAQAGGYWIERHSGNAGLQFTYALLVSGAALALFLLIRRSARDVFPALAVCALYVALEWQQIFIIRPQLAGMLLFPILLACWRSRSYRWGAIPVMALWTNLHGSFVVGLVATGLMLVGTGLDLGFRTGQVALVFRRRDRRTLIVYWLAMSATTLCNPFGARLLWDVVTFASNPNLYSLIEWKSILATPKQGKVALGASIVSVVLLIVSRRRFLWRDWLPVLVFGAMMFRSSRYIVWFGPLLSIALFPHVSDLFRRCRTVRWMRIAGQLVAKPLPSGRIALAAAALIAVTTTPLAQAVLGRQEWSPPDSYSARTPRGASRFLQEHPPSGLILNTLEWGDWLIWASHGRWKPMAGSHVNWLPPKVWRDYLKLSKCKPGWDAALQRYPLTLAVLDRRKQGKLANALFHRPEWRVVYRDRLAVILQKTR